MKFYNGCPNPNTRYGYQNAVDYYVRFLGIKDLELLLKGQSVSADKEAIARGIEDNLERFIQHHKAQKASAYLIGLRLAAVKKFYKKNRMSKLIDWDYIREDVGQAERRTGSNSGGDDYKIEDIQKMRKIAFIIPQKKVKLNNSKSA